MKDHLNKRKPVLDSEKISEDMLEKVIGGRKDSDQDSLFENGKNSGKPKDIGPAIPILEPWIGAENDRDKI